MMKKGTTGEQVKKWQEFLISQGFKIKADKDFGTATESATRSFQASAGLRDDGMVGDMTLAAAREKGYKPAVIAVVGASAGVGAVGAAMGKVILISAGHSTVPPRDPGATGNNYIEAREALRVRDALAAELRGKGFEVLEDGADGISDPLNKALALARRADLAVEIHFNAGPPTATGIEVLCKPDKRALAQRMCAAVADATGMRLRGDRGYRPDDSGQHHRLAFCEARGMILEVAFISNADDMRRYSENFEKIVKNLAAAIAS